MRRSSKIAQEAKKNSIASTYDLAIAKVVMVISTRRIPSILSTWFILDRNDILQGPR